MHYLLSKSLNIGTWFFSGMFFITEYAIDVDVVYKSIIAIMSFFLLVLQLSNQWNIRQDRKEKKAQEGKVIILDKDNSYGEFKDSIIGKHENLKKKNNEAASN